MFLHGIHVWHSFRGRWIDHHHRHHHNHEMYIILIMDSGCNLSENAEKSGQAKGKKVVWLASFRYVKCMLLE
jgi:hypothetical protein